MASVSATSNGNTSLIIDTLRHFERFSKMATKMASSLSALTMRSSWKTKTIYVTKNAILQRLHTTKFNVLNTTSFKW